MQGLFHALLSISGLSVAEIFRNRVLADDGDFEGLDYLEDDIDELSSFYSGMSFILTPNAVKSSKIYSLKPTDGSGDLVFTRALAARRKTETLLGKVGLNVARLDYTSSYPSFLIEPARTQLLTNGLKFTDATWVKTNTTVSHNVISGPDLWENDNIIEVQTNYVACTCTAANKVNIFNKSNPEALTLTAAITTTSGPLGIAVTPDQNYLVVTCYLANKVEIYDISTIASPSLVSTITSGAGSFIFSSPWNVTMSDDGNTIFILYSNGVESANITTRSSPTFLGRIVHGGSVLLQTPLEAAYDATNSMLWVASYASNAVEGINISNPASMTHVCSIADGAGGAELSEVHSIVKKGNYLLTACRAGGAFEVIDITTPSSPTHSAKITGLAGPTDVKYINNVAVVSAYDGNRIRFFDISTITAPVSVSFVNDGQDNANIFLADQSLLSSDGHCYSTARGGNALSVINYSDVNNPYFVSKVETDDNFKVLETVTNAAHSVRYDHTKSSGSQSFVLMVRAKSGLGRDYICLQSDDGTNGAGKFFNLTTGALGNNRTVGSSYSINDSQILSDGEGGYLCFIRVTTTSSTTLRFVVFSSTDGSTLSYAGDITKGFYIKEAKLIQSASPLTDSFTPISTIGGTALRPADIISELTGVTTLIGQTQGTLYFRGNSWADSVNKGVICISDGTTNNRVLIEMTTGNLIRALVVSGGVTQADISQAFLSGTAYKVALTYQSNKVALFINGSKIGEDLTVTVPACSSIRMDTGAGSNPFYGNIGLMSISPTALSDADAQTLTTP